MRVKNLFRIWIPFSPLIKRINILLIYPRYSLIYLKTLLSHEKVIFHYCLNFWYFRILFFISNCSALRYKMLWAGSDFEKTAITLLSFSNHCPNETEQKLSFDNQELVVFAASALKRKRRNKYFQSWSEIRSLWFSIASLMRRFKPYNQNESELKSLVS